MNNPNRPPIAWKLVALLAGFKFLIHLVTVGAWGSEWFVDELYFMACAEHLDWGYVDLPPLLPAVLASVTAVFGDSLLVVRLIAALAGAGLVVLTAALARELGGGRWAQTSAGVCVIVAPIYLIMHGFTTMNALDPLFWVGCALVLARILNGGDPRLWLLFGLIAGLGVNSKNTFALWGAAMVIGLLTTRARSVFRSKWIWLGGLVALVLVLPNLVWVAGHGFPHLEQLTNIRAQGRDVALSPFAFFGQQVLMLNPPSAVVWLAGLVWLLFGSAGARYRSLGVAWSVTMLALIFLGGRPYYPAPAHPVLLAAGGVASPRSGIRRLVAVAPAGYSCRSSSSASPSPDLTVVPVAGSLRSLHRSSRFRPAADPEPRARPVAPALADRYGWRHAEETARVYHALPADERRPGGDLWPELRPGGRRRPLPKNARSAAGDLRASELLPLGAARRHRVR